MSKPPRFVVGIDLGTTNTTVSWGKVSGGEIHSYPIPQLVAEGEVAPRSVLSSALYLAGEHDVPEGALALPWATDDRQAVGLLARALGARVAGRLVASAKSWLCHGGVDRDAAILPWGGSDDVAKVSPVAASTAVLAHVRAAWNQEHPKARLEEQDVVLTVPASFDEVARELTVRAALDAGLPKLRLLEEPQAAIYAWIAAHDGWEEALGDHRNILVLDVGGGTTDFSTIAVRPTEEGVGLERVAVGDHILLGGDNMDLALATRVLERAKSGTLDAARWQQLSALCRDAKERLLGEESPPKVPISVAGRGRGVVAGAVRADLEADDVLREVLDGFFPPAEAGATPEQGSRAGLVEFGLPYAADPAITRHLAAFLRGAATDDDAAMPDAVLFNGGAVTPDAVRGRVLDVLETWSGHRPLELAGADLDLAVSRGAVAYGYARRGIGLRIAGGAPRSYYLALGDDADADSHRVLCIAARGMEEGTELDIREHDFVVTANEPVRFGIYASTTRTGDAAGALLEVPAESVLELPQMTTVLRFGRSLESRDVPVNLSVHLTETGTLEVWCLSKTTDHRWRLSFDLRARAGVEGATGPAVDDAAAPDDSQELVVPEESLTAALALLESCFVGDDVKPVEIGRRLEEIFGAGKDAWPLSAIRRLLDRLLELEKGRHRTPDHEARWLNLAGFFIRPGWGEERDGWRAEQLWRLFDRGLAFGNATQGRAEWWTLWKRAAGGLSRAQQQVLHQEIRPVLLPETRKKGKALRWKAGKQELREMWQVVGSLERIEAGSKRELAAVLAPRVAKGKASEAEVWALGRLGARAMVYGPANAVVPPAEVEKWLGKLVKSKWERPPAAALAVAQMARKTGDPARDVSAKTSEAVAERLASESSGKAFARWVREVVPMDTSQQALVLSEKLPTGLRIVGAAGPGASSD